MNATQKREQRRAKLALAHATGTVLPRSHYTRASVARHIAETIREAPRAPRKAPRSWGWAPDGGQS